MGTREEVPETYTAADKVDASLRVVIGGHSKAAIRKPILYALLALCVAASLFATVMVVPALTLIIFLATTED